MVPLSVSTADGIRQKVVSDLGRVKDAVYGGLGYAPRLMGLLVKLRGPRKEYARAAIETIVEVDKAVRQQGGTAADAASAVNLVPGFERVTRRQILRWKELLRAIAEGKPGGLRGRPTDKEFEERVFSKLVVLVATKRAPTTLTREEVVDVEDYERFPDDTGIDLRKVTTVKENIAYSYGMVAMAAERTQAEAVYVNDVKITGLKFSARWIQGFLRRNLFRKRTVVTDAKPWPSITGPLEPRSVVVVSHIGSDVVVCLCVECNRDLGVIQETQVVNDLTREQELFFDESPLNAPRPKIQYVLGNVRGTNVRGGGSGKERITDGIFNAGDGELPPSFLVVRCSSKKSDMTNVVTIKNLWTEPGLTCADGWDYKHWTESVTIKGKGGVQKLIRRVDGTVITCQSKVGTTTYSYIRCVHKLITFYRRGWTKSVL